MKKILSLAAVIFFLNFSNVFSQDDSKWERDNSLKEGKWALQFAIDQNFSLTNFEGSIISIKKQFSEKRAIRLGLSLSFENNNGTSSHISGFDTIPDTDFKLTGYSVYATPTLMFYLNPRDAVNLYTGAGIILGGSYYWNEAMQNLPDGYNYRYERSYSYGGGITGLLGVEFFPIKNLSILAEYFASFQYNHYSGHTIYDVPGEYSVHNSKNNQFDFNGQQVNFGLSVYF
jgi:hypothetical protein